MSVENIDVNGVIEETNKLLENEKYISPAIRACLKIQLLLINILVNKLWLNSGNSSIPPSQDPNRNKNKDKDKTWKKPGGQKWRKGKTLAKVDNPDKVVEIKVDRCNLPEWNYKPIGYEARQEFDIDISISITEFRAEILENERWEKYTAIFPKWIKSSTQYWNWVKSHCVYLSQYQLIPYNRVWEYFEDQVKLPISMWSISNFNQGAYDLLDTFENRVKHELINSRILHADETWININGKRHWLHWCSNKNWTLLYPHKKRGKEAMDEIWILEFFIWLLSHDHWKPYYAYKLILHCLCNAHHLRELERVTEQDDYKWWETMKKFLINLNNIVEDSGWALTETEVKPYIEEYQKILKEADIECPWVEPPPNKDWKKKRWWVKQTKARNLLDRLINYQDDVLRFAVDKDAPFSNNLWERDIRMTKVQQKISWCFRSMEGAKTFCRIRSYISSARKQWFTASYALRALFDGIDIFSEIWAE